MCIISLSAVIFLAMLIKNPLSSLAAWGFIISLLALAMVAFIKGTQKENNNETTYVQHP